MQKEIQGYNSVKDFMGKGVPAFGRPVSHANYTGIKMELAAIEAFILRSILLPHLQDLPKALSFVKDDSRFNKIYSTIRLLRKTYLSIKTLYNHAFHLHLAPDQLKNVLFQEKETQGIEDVAWVPISPEVINSLFANHSQIIKKILEKLLENADVRIDRQYIQDTILQI